jgi:hypothetical protein
VSDCLSCKDPKSKLINGSCILGCNDNEIMIPGTTNCLSIQSCIASFELIAPKIYPMEMKVFSISASFVLTSDCEVYSSLINDNISFTWTDTYGGTLSNSNKNLTVNLTEEFSNNQMNFELDVIFNKIIIYSAKSSVFFKIDKVRKLF